MRIEKQVSMIIGADIVPTQENQQLFTEGNINALVGENIEKILYEADLRLFNLEAPLITMKHPIKKNGPILGVPTSAIKGIKKLNPSCLTVANNHIMDHDVEGMETTCQMLKDVGIPYVGVGKDITSMLHSYVIEKNGLKIGIYVCVEHEFSIATKYRAGANPFDPFESFDHVSILKEKCDYLIVLYHGGKEMYRYPTPNLQKTCRKLVEKGADLVVCQHSHCIGCEENFLGKKIIYGQGNFIFGKYENDYFKNSLLLNVILDGKECEINYIPIMQHSPGICLADEAVAKEIMEKFYERSRKITDPLFVENRFKEEVEKNKYYLIQRIDYFSNSFLYKSLKKIVGIKFIQRYYQAYCKKIALRAQNSIECESWREFLIAALEENL